MGLSAVGAVHQAHGAHFHLALGLFSRDIQHLPLSSHFKGHLQHERGFPNARVAAYQNDRAGHNTAPQHTRKLTNGQIKAVFLIPFNLMQAAWDRTPHTQARLWGAGLSWHQGWRDHFLDHRPPTTTLRAATHRSRRGAPTTLTDISRLYFAHDEERTVF